MNILLFYRKLFFTILFFVIVSSCRVFASGERFAVGARQAGMGKVSVALTGFWGIANNQAGIALIDKITAGINYTSYFGLSQLSTKNAAVLVPGKFGVAGVSVSYYGYHLYNEMQLGLAYGRAFGKYLRIGLQLDYLQTSIGDNYGKKSNITFEIGLQSDVTENLSLGLWLYNPMSVKLAAYDNERIPAIYRFGLAFRFESNLLSSVELEKNSYRQAVILRGGLEYILKQRFFLRVGFSTSQEIFSMGFGMKLKMLRFDIAAVMHQSLGFSPQAGLIFRF